MNHFRMKISTTSTWDQIDLSRYSQCTSLTLFNQQQKYSTSKYTAPCWIRRLHVLNGCIYESDVSFAFALSLNISTMNRRIIASTSLGSLSTMQLCGCCSTSITLLFTSVESVPSENVSKHSSRFSSMAPGSLVAIVQNNGRKRCGMCGVVKLDNKRSILSRL